MDETLLAAAERGDVVPAAASGLTPREEPPAYTILVEQDGERFFASWTTGDGKEAGCGSYSSTVVGALAELCSTLLKVDEDKAIERHTSAAPPLSLTPPEKEPR